MFELRINKNNMIAFKNIGNSLEKIANNNAVQVFSRFTLAASSIAGLVVGGFAVVDIMRPYKLPVTNIQRELQNMGANHRPLPEQSLLSEE